MTPPVEMECSHKVVDLACGMCCARVLRRLGEVYRSIATGWFDVRHVPRDTPAQPDLSHGWTLATERMPPDFEGVRVILRDDNMGLTQHGLASRLERPDHRLATTRDGWTLWYHDPTADMTRFRVLAWCDLEPLEHFLGTITSGHL